ncbi:hypothetical protein FHS18_006636 [Paenibacillus phyllosphaerae]|uniref:Uncharacterized protein n=1 Tax=Paenibacillus phyllosphaerae TaxID=274593 RepID=A0A7W5B4Z3_9BACL|nr:CBO0543 family protein [Paenibacillus phyllosphaerae]MBB3114515.1 hypothetical protein [Paenibacillus phyllosphaerae]
MLHMAVSALLLLINWKRGALANWKTYHATMLYIVVCDLTYNYFCKEYPLWIYELDRPVKSHHTIELMYSYFFLPLTALLFLSLYPKQASRVKRLLYIFAWILLYMIWEGSFFLLERISYDNGWNLLWSLGFYFEMFPMLLLHHNRPRLAYLLSIGAAAVWLFLFHVPLK